MKLKYIIYLVLSIGIFACSYKVTNPDSINLSSLKGIKAIYYMGVDDFVIEVRSDDLFQNVTVKDNYGNKFDLTKKRALKEVCFEGSPNISLCLGENVAIFSKQNQKPIKLVLISLEK